MPKFRPHVTEVAIIFLVKDLQVTCKFYLDALGLQLDEREGYLDMKMPNGTEILFFEGEAQPGGSPQIVFGLDRGGIDTIAEGLAERGAQLVTPVSEAPGGWSVQFQDPDGHPLAFFQSASLPKTLQQ
jgi:glyoxylase I family protein